MDRSTEPQIDRARRLLEQHQPQSAVELLTRVLAESPESAEAHALLGLALVVERRLHAAQIEIDTALRLEPESITARAGLASIAIAQRRFRQAELILADMLAADPEAYWPQAELVRLYWLWDRQADAYAALMRARALWPDEPDLTVLEARLAHASGRLDVAELLAREVLTQDPGHADAVLMLAEVEISRGQIAAAREHLAWALNRDPGSERAIELLVGLKARSNPLLGLWWRFQAFVGAGHATRSLIILLATYVAYRLASQMLRDLGQPSAALWLSLAWLAFCVYTWVAPGFFRRMLQRELAQVKLRHDF